MNRMQYISAVVSGITLLLAGCLPDDPVAGLYAGAISADADTLADREAIAQGASAIINYQTFNDAGRTATVNVLVEHAALQTRTTVAADQPVADGTSYESVDWDTADAEPGSYAVLVQIVSDNTLLREDRAEGLLVVDGKPTFVFTAPTTDANLPADGRLIISWEASDAEEAATAQVGLDTDDDRTNGNEIYLSEAFTLTADDEEAIQEWDGTDVDGADVAAGTYALFALVTDAAHGVEVVEATGTVTVP